MTVLARDLKSLWALCRKPAEDLWLGDARTGLLCVARAAGLLEGDAGGHGLLGGMEGAQHLTSATRAAVGELNPKAWTL
jgi:hypothetical protein